tara:strand:+ start:2843 stop:3343 length:501 start_codon:yes stop_codon:yes gene_type:complete
MALTATAFTYVVLPTDGTVVTSAGQTVAVGDVGMPKYVINGKERITRVRLQLDAASTNAAYPTSGGIPLSTSFSDYGLTRNLNYIMMYSQGIHEAPTGLATGLAMFVHRTPATGGPGYIVGFGAWATGAGPSTAATGRHGFPELPTTWVPGTDPWTHLFYVEAHGW